MHRFTLAAARRALGLSLAALACAPAHADTHWLCGLTEGATQLACVADLDPRAETLAAAAPVSTVRGTTFPLDVRRRWVVDLWSPPTEPAFVEQLARATLCYRTPGCSVSVAPWR